MSLLDLPLPAWAVPAFKGRHAPGFCVVDHLPEHLYHDSHALLSKSLIQKAATPYGSMEKFHYAITAPKSPPTDALTEGSALHVAVLEPDLFGSRYIELPDFQSIRGITLDKQRANWMQENAVGLIGLRPTQMHRIHAQSAALRNNADIRAMLRHARTEVSVAWTHRATGLRMRSRADFANEVVAQAGDLKRALHADPQRFARAADSLGYHIQDYLYTMGLRQAGLDVRNFVFFACEPEPPYAVSLFQFEAPSRLAAESVVDRALDRIARAVESNVFPGYTDGVMGINIPNYSLYEAERIAAEDEAEEARTATYRSV